MNNNSIGFFDSGIGGITIWESVNRLLPNENTIYLADSKNSPYGKKTNDELINISKENVEFLINEKCKLIVVACNTATTNSINFLRKSYDLPFIGIEPAIKPAALNTKTGKIGVLATKGTLGSSLFEKTSNIHGQNVEIIEQHGLGLVELIEKGIYSGSKIDSLLKEYLNPMLENNIDKLVLGCTHYPLIKESIKKIINESINIVECSEAVALQTERVLIKSNLINSGTEKSKKLFYTNGDKNVLNSLLNNKFEILMV
ncbi:MAG: glutamate racemase [Cryomorphaceae bacterium MED-G14]|nr:MAG: glutamate racemase [Cryomorphaceae bacterium MED-G14]|tara:strand:+ start:230 stop:1003 length:774 start_codon:yes stop_codon:yes gene_type:complete